MLESLLIGAVAALLLVPPVVGMYRRRARAIAARAEAQKWPAVPGRIISSTLNAHGHTTGSALATVVRAVVWYEYFIAGRRYSSDVIDIGDDVLRESAPNSRLFMRVRPETLVDRYQEGAEVLVYVDPADPGRSCLER
jgi:hypothetical protein